MKAPMVVKSFQELVFVKLLEQTLVLQMDCSTLLVLVRILMYRQEQVRYFKQKVKSFLESVLAQ